MNSLLAQTDKWGGSKLVEELYIIMKLLEKLGSSCKLKGRPTRHYLQEQDLASLYTTESVWPDSAQ